MNGAIRHALIFLDHGGTIRVWNPGAERVFGTSAEEAIGQSFVVLLQPEDRESGAAERRLASATESGVVDDTLWMVRADGSKFWAEFTMAAIQTNSGARVDGFSLIIRDATERRRAEEKVDRISEELERFVFTVSHDLQEPLRTVRSYAELLQRRYAGKLDADADEFIGFLVGGTTRMTQLLKDIVSYSRAGRADRTRPERTEASAVLQWALMNLDPQIQAAGASITHDPLPCVHVDQNQFLHLLEQVVGNSLKFRGEAAPAPARPDHE